MERRGRGLPLFLAKQRSNGVLAMSASSQFQTSRVWLDRVASFATIVFAPHRTLKRIGTVNSKVSPGILGGGGGNG